ncbi:Protein ECERIFERUM 26-like [Bienertia sinuspersici]
MAKSLELSSINNIESVYSTTPKKMTEPRLSCKISRMHIILCYKKNQSNEINQDYYGLHIGGWLKESLGSALMEHPILAGRLRRSDNGGLEIVSNDSGVRCVEVQMPLNLVDFLESKEMNNEVEGNLVYWQDIENSNPQFSPLFYVQVTKFQCGGYSLGISCSLLLTDPLNMANFLKRWAEIHRSMAIESKVSRTHLLPKYTLNFKNGFSGLEYGTTHISSTSTTTSKSIIFNISTKEKFIHSSDEIYNV